MKIDNKEFLNPQQQLYQNTKDIEKLKADYQPVYSYSGLIGSTEIHTVNRSSTNVPTGVNIGWLMDYTGKLFKITDGSATALLIDYYAQIKGDTGATGPQGEKGDKGDTGPQGPQGEPGETTIGVEILSQLPDATSETYESYKNEIVFVPNSSSDDENQYDEYMIQKDELKNAYSYTLPTTYEMETLGVIFGEEPISEYETIYSDTYNDSISVKFDTTNFKAIIKNTSGGTYNRYYIFDQQNSINGWYDDEAATTPVSGSVSAAHYNPGSPYFVYQDFDRIYAVLTGKASAYYWELLGGATVDLTDYALKSEIPVIDEDLIPKAFNTYVLGDNTHSYKEVVANKFKSPNSYYEISGANISSHGQVTIKTTDGNGTDEAKLQLGNTALYCNKNIAPLGSTVNLGQANNGFNNLYLDGKIVTDDNLTYGFTLPDTTNYTADKTLATTDDITTVVANPTLAGTESDLTSIDIGGTAYKIGKDLYWQQYQCYQSYTDASHPGFSFVFQIYTDTELNINNKTKLIEFLASKGLKDSAPRLEVLYGELTQDDGTTWRKIEGIHTNSGGTVMYAVCPEYSSVGAGAFISRNDIQLPYLAISRMFSIKL